MNQGSKEVGVRLGVSQGDNLSYGSVGVKISAAKGQSSWKNLYDRVHRYSIEGGGLIERPGDDALYGKAETLSVVGSDCITVNAINGNGDE